MQKVLLTALLLFAGYAQAQSCKNFVHAGFSNNVTVSGNFCYTDLNKDGMIMSTELSVLTVTVQQNGMTIATFGLTETFIFSYSVQRNQFEPIWLKGADYDYFGNDLVDFGHVMLKKPKPVYIGKSEAGVIIQ